MARHQTTIEAPRGDFIPKALRERLARFCVDKKTGNMVINISQGRIMGIHLTEMLNFPKTE